MQHSTSRTAPTGAVLPFATLDPRESVAPRIGDAFYKALDLDNEHLRSPRTIRPHFGKREFGRFAPVLAAAPASQDMQARVLRWRERDAAEHAREDLPLQAYPDQSADDRRLMLAMMITSALIIATIVIGVVDALAKGLL